MKPKSRPCLISIIAGVSTLMFFPSCAENAPSSDGHLSVTQPTPDVTGSATQASLGLGDVRQPVIEHRYQSAIAICDVILKTSQKKLAEDQAAHPGPSNFIDVVGLDQIMVCAVYSTKAQIYALMGDFSLANDAINAGDGVIKMGNPVSKVTRGFIQEKQGNLAEATRLYLEDSEGSFLSDPTEARDRLALLAIEAGNVEDAKKYLGGGETPTQQIVLGLIAISEKDLDKAAACFKQAKALIENPGTGNPTMPIVYCEDVPTIKK